jgi:hypothetical protein
MTYQDSRPWAKAIRDEVLARRMPPWGAAEGVGDFKHDQSLTSSELAMLVDWVEGSAPEGDPKYLPKPPVFSAMENDTSSFKVLRIANSSTLPTNVSLAAIRPATPMQVTAYLPGGSVQQLLWLKRYEKLTYFLRSPVILPKGTKIVLYGENLSGCDLLIF